MPRLHAELATTVNSHLAAVPPAQIRAFDEEISAVPGLVKLTLGVTFTMTLKPKL